MPQIPHESKTPLNPYKWFLDHYEPLYDNDTFRACEYNRKTNEFEITFGKPRMSIEDCRRLLGCDAKDMWRILCRANNNDINKYLKLVATVIANYVSYFLSVLEKQLSWKEVCSFISDMYENDWLSITNGETKRLAENIYKENKKS